jgi:hypothetical protein
MPKFDCARLVAIALAAAAAGLVGCQSPPAASPPAASPPAATDAQPWVVGWESFPFPGKRATAYAPLKQDDRWVMHATSERSASMYRRVLRVEPGQLDTLTFSWKVAALVEGADVRESETEDAPVRVLLAFDGDHGRLNQRTRMMFDLMHSLTGEMPPYATLMYVWDGNAAADSLVVNRRSNRIRKIVVESGPAHLGQWRNYRRDVVADYRRAFGEDPGALIAVAVMTDTDNTQTRAEAWYGEVSLQLRPSP